MAVTNAAATAANKRGADLFAKGRVAGAVRHYRSALRMAPQYVHAWFNLGAAYGELARQQAARSRVAADRSDTGALSGAGCGVGAGGSAGSQPAGSRAGGVGRVVTPLEAKMASLARLCFLKALHINPLFAHAASDLGAMLLKDCRLLHASTMCQWAHVVDPTLAEPSFNLNSVLRRLGRQEQAIGLAWATIRSRVRNSSFEPRCVDVNGASPADTDKGAVVAPRTCITFACVKWGTKYGPEYVNKLYAGVMRHLGNMWQPKARFVCFTEDPSDLHPDIEVVPFPVPEATAGASAGAMGSALDSGSPGTPVRLQGWWNKVLLFAPLEQTTLRGRVVFIDLDTVCYLPVCTAGATLCTWLMTL